MKSIPPHIAITHIRTVPSDSFEEFRAAIASREVQVQVRAIDPLGPMAGIEWLMPTFVIGFVGSAYFGGFFQEMGKDHYLLVKEQFKKLYLRVAGPETPNVELVGTKGKIKAAQPYSLYFSLVGEGPNGLNLKLLLKKSITVAEYERSVDCFLDLLRDVNLGTLSDAARKRFEAVIPIGRTLLVVYDDDLDQVVPIDPLTGELRR